MHRTPSAALLVLPGWDDDGRQQYEALRAQLAPAHWRVQRAHLPDASWSGAARARVTREDTTQQVLADYDALVAAHGGTPRRIAVLGFSYGGYMAAFLVAARPVDLLLLRSPAIYPDADWRTPKEDLDKRALQAYRQQVLAPAQNRALRCCAHFGGHALLIDSEHDEVIAPPVIASYAQALASARSLRRHTLPGADHALTDAAWQRAYHAVAVAWLQAHAPS